MYLIWPGALRHAMASVWQRRTLVRHRLPEKSIMMNTRLDRDWISGMRRKAASAALVLAGALVLTIITTQSAHAALTTLYNFCSQSNCADGANPNKALFQGTDGNFYGATAAGGAGAGGQYGTVFQITPSGVLTTLHSFCSQSNCADGMLPSALIQASDGNFYGTTRQGGVGAFDPYGTVFQITPSGTLTTLYNFCSQSNCTDGFFPDAALIQASDGNFYGTTSQGGVDGYGTVFKIPLSPGDTLTTIHSIVCSSESCPEGYAPETALVQATDGTFYGTTLYSAYTTQGSVFQVTPSGTFTGLYTFCHTSGCPDGAIPNAALVQGTDGNLYGTTEKGGAYAQGTVFQITPSGTLTTLYSFCATSGCPDGASPYAALVQGRGGVFYGTTYSGGAYNKGSVFQITSSGALTTLYSFCATSGCPDGASPYAALIQATQELQWMAEPQIVDEGRPIDLQHPQWVGQRLGRVRRHPRAIANLAHRIARTAKRPGNLAQSPPFTQPPPDLLKPPHRHAALPHIVNSFVWTHEGSRIGSGGRGYRRAAAATMAVVATAEINGNLSIGRPLAPSGAQRSAPQVVPN